MPSNPVVPIVNPLEKEPPSHSGLTPNLTSGSIPPEVLAVLKAAAEALSLAVQALQRVDSQHSPPQHPGQNWGTKFEDKTCPVGFVTFGSIVRDFLLARARAGRSDRYLRQLRSSLAWFVQGRSTVDARSITPGQLESWVEARGGAPRTRRGYLKDLRCLFEWCVRRQLLSINPAASTELPSGNSERKIEVHTPAEVSEVLTVAFRLNPNVGRHLAVRYFAGLRSAECHRLSEASILKENGFLEVTAAQAKTRSRRLVTLQPALLAFLELGGELVPMSPNRIREVVKASGVHWPHNVTRHSFVSYHLGHFGNAGKTAVEAGHSEAMLFRHYRALVTPSSAASFWALRP